MTRNTIEIAAYVGLWLVSLPIVWRTRGGRLYVLLSLWWAVVITLTAARGGWFGDWRHLLGLLLAPVLALLNYLKVGMSPRPIKRSRTAQRE